MVKGMLENKVVVVTGAGSPIGFGRAIGLEAARQGAVGIVCADIDGEAVLETVRAIGEEVAHTSATATKAVGVQADISVLEDVLRIMQVCVDTFGRCDVYVANAGVLGMLSTAVSSDTQDLQRDLEFCLKVNTIGTAMCAHSAYKQMLKQPEGGAIVCIASVAGMRSGAGTMAYSASKAACISLCQTMALEIGRSNVRINAVCPGLVETGMTKAGLFDPARKRGTVHKVGQINPLGRAGLTQEIANVTVYMGSQKSSYMTGQAIAVDGGLSSCHPWVFPKNSKSKL